jgi:hypothetical protein
MPISPHRIARILDPRTVLETLLDSTKSFEIRERGLSTKYVSKKSLKLTDAEKNKLSIILWGEEADRI